ncbi:MAG: hypothetical protein ABIG63_11270 [Chloroflexota bacterium]
MSLIRRIGFLTGPGNRDMATSSAGKATVNGTADADWIDVIGLKADTAATGAVGTTKSIVAYLKQLVTDLLTLIAGTAIGMPFSITKTLTPTTAGTTLVTATGSMLIDEISIQAIAGETTGITDIFVTTNDTIALKQALRKEDGQPIQLADISTAGKRYNQKVNHVMLTTKVMTLWSTGANGTASNYYVTVTGRRYTAGATLA